MSTVVFDIETVAIDWDSFHDTIKQHLLKDAHTKDEIQKVKQSLSLSPFTGKIASLTMYDIERKRGVTYLADELGEETFDVPEGFLVKHRCEKEILEEFWEGIQNYDVLVTFNGRSFAVPFLIHRSIASSVKPSNAFLQTRYLSKQSLPYHVDLFDEFTWYGAMNKRPSLSVLCQAYGIENQNDKDALSSWEKSVVDRAKHNIHDVLCIKTLYEKWKQYLAPASFLNTTEL